MNHSFSMVKAEEKIFSKRTVLAECRPLSLKPAKLTFIDRLLRESWLFLASCVFKIF